MACVATPSNEKFYYLHDKVLQQNPQKINPEAPNETNFEEPSNWGVWGPPSPPEIKNNCTAMVVYEPPLNKNNVSENNKICYHNKIFYKCNYGNRFANFQLEYDKVWSLDQRYNKK